MSSVSVKDATAMRKTWQRLQVDAMPLAENEYYSLAVLRTLPSHVEQEVQRQILKPELQRSHMLNREAGITAAEWTPAALAPGTEKVAFIREKVFSVMIAVAKSNPELSRSEHIFDLQVALVVACRSVLVSFCTFARLSNFFHLLDFSDPPDAPTFQRSPSCGRPPTDGHRDPTTLMSKCAVPPVMPVEPATTSSARPGEEDPLIQEVLQVWRGIRRQYPLVATAIQQDRRTTEMFIVCVRRWLQTLFAAGSSTSDQQLCAYVPLLDFMVLMAYRKLDCVTPRQLLWRIAVCIFGCHRERVEELRTSVEAMEDLLHQFADRPPIDSRVLLSVACQVSNSPYGVSVLKGLFASQAKSAWNDFIAGRACGGVLQCSLAANFISSRTLAAVPRRSSGLVSPARSAVAEEGPVLEDAQQSPFRMCTRWMPIEDIACTLVWLGAGAGRQC